MRTSRLLVAFTLMSVSACAGRQQAGLVGQGTAFVQPRDAAASPDVAVTRPPWAVGGGMQLAQGSYELALWFDIPRAQVVDWTVTCPGVEVTGTAGESFAQYRARRIEELRAARGRDQVASITPVQTDAISDAVTSDAIELAPGDLGAGRLVSTVRVMTGGAGVCAVTATADDATVLGTYQVTRIRDPQLEERARAAAQQGAVIQVSSRVQTGPVAQESALVEHHLAAARAQAAARLELETEARVQAQNAYEAQIRAQQDAEVVRARVVVDQDQRRLDVAQRARDDLRRRWVAWGAIPRPPMPALLAEVPGEPPFPGARWVPGVWEWVNGRWTWRAGSWSDPDVFDDSGGDLMVGVETGFEVEVGSDGGGERSRPRIVDHRTGPRIRDHRNGTDDSAPTIRDHRDGQSPSSKLEPTVRDHRNNAREELPKSTIHDHRDARSDKPKDDDKDDDRSGNVRDHRRR